jgi:phosphonate degradation associated HDIG domain protein
MNKLTNLSEIEDLFEKWGKQLYSERLSQTAHAVQCAVLAEESGASSDLVLASLLHDIGHLIDLETSSGREEHEIDTEHEATGARAISPLFPPTVAAPIALHVAAKRYLCFIEPTYFDGLSEASVATLALQGGPMSEDEANRFAAMPHAKNAVSLRRWDELGKDTTKDMNPLDEFRQLLHKHFNNI